MNEQLDIINGIGFVESCPPVSTLVSAVLNDALSLPEAGMLLPPGGSSLTPEQTFDVPSVGNLAIALLDDKVTFVDIQDMFS